MPQSPNILLIMADQLVPFLTGAYDHPVVKTPQLDRLVERGVRFDVAYTPCPLCTPARAAFVTGKYASTLGCYDNAAVLPADEPTLAHYLTNAGYETVLSGKMHFIGPDQLHGFRHRLTTDVFPAGVNWVPSLDAAGKFVGGGHARGYVAPNVGVRPWTKFLSYDEETHFRALEYIRAGTHRANGAVLPRRLLPSPPRSLPRHPGAVGPLRGRGDCDPGVPKAPGGELLGDGPLAQRGP